MIKIFVLHCLLFLVVFLIMLNGSLRGRSKSVIETVLGTVWLALIGSVFYFGGWKSGLLGLGLTFVYAIVVNPLAKTVARRLLG